MSRVVNRDDSTQSTNEVRATRYARAHVSVTLDPWGVDRVKCTRRCDIIQPSIFFDLRKQVQLPYIFYISQRLDSRLRRQVFTEAEICSGHIFSRSAVFTELGPNASKPRQLSFHHTSLCLHTLYLAMDEIGIEIQRTVSHIFSGF